MRCCGRNKAGEPGLVGCGRQHSFHGDFDQRNVPCFLSDDELWRLILSGMLFPRDDGGGEQLVIEAS